MVCHYIRIDEKSTGLIKGGIKKMDDVCNFRFGIICFMVLLMVPIGFDKTYKNASAHVHVMLWGASQSA